MKPSSRRPTPRQIPTMEMRLLCSHFRRLCAQPWGCRAHVKAALLLELTLKPRIPSDPLLGPQCPGIRPRSNRALPCPRLRPCVGHASHPQRSAPFVISFLVQFKFQRSLPLPKPAAWCHTPCRPGQAPLSAPSADASVGHTHLRVSRPFSLFVVCFVLFSETRFLCGSLAVLELSP